MKTTSAFATFIKSNAGRATSLSILGLAGIAGAALLYFHNTQFPLVSRAATIQPLTGVEDSQARADPSTSLPTADNQPLAIPKDKALAMGLEIASIERGSWPTRLRVTGRLQLNESRVAQVSPLVNGVVRELLVELGKTVECGEVLAYIDSREVGEAKLKLIKVQLQLTSARKNSAWYRTIHKNTFALLEALQHGRPIDEIETAFQDRPIGTYREQLVSSFARQKRAKADFERIRQLGEDGIIPEKEIIRSRAEREAAEATYRALKEQIRFDAEKQALDAAQELHSAEAAVAISRSHLLILGYSEDDIDSMDPIAEAERVAYYPIRSPIAGTIIAKNAPLSKHVDDEMELFQIADLSTIWMNANVFEKDLNAVVGLQGKPVTFEANSYPGRRWTANIFSLGDVVDDETRAARLIAMVDNTDRLLKPGMFVEVELTPEKDVNVLQLPTSAIQRHAGATFVFVSNGDESFERRDVAIGRSTSKAVEIISGLADGEFVAVQGGFGLKSEMLSELMTEE